MCKNVAWYQLLFKSLAACRDEIRSIIFRSIISSAISHDVRWIMGLPAFSGFSHASASIWQRWSAVILLGAPGRGPSCRRSSMLKSSKEIVCAFTQRLRQRCAVLMLTPYFLAIALVVCPCPAANMMRPSNSIC